MPGPVRRRPAGLARDRLSIEQIAAIDPPTSFRVAPDGRSVVFLAERAGAQQVVRMPLHGGYPQQLTASEHDCSDPRWSPDGTRVAYVERQAIWVIDADGGHPSRLADHPAGCVAPRWSPDGERLIFLSRRRGWSQLWLVDAPRAGRGRPPAALALEEPRRLTPGQHDNEQAAWAPDGMSVAFTSSRSEDLLTNQIVVLDVARALARDAAAERIVAGEASWACAPSWAPDGRSLAYLDDRDGWFDVCRVDPQVGESSRIRLTHGGADHGDTEGGDGIVPRFDPTGRRIAYVRVHDGLVDLVVRRLQEDGETTVNPFPGVWKLVGWVGADRLAAVAEADDRPQDLWILPVLGVAPAAARPQQVTHSRPGGFPAHRCVASSRATFLVRDGLPIEATLWLPGGRTPGGGSAGAGAPDDGPADESSPRDGGVRGAPRGRRLGRVPAVIHPHGGPTSQTYRGFQPFLQMLVQEGMAVVAPDFRGSTGYGREFRWANRNEWGHADAQDIVDCARWAARQPWCDGRLAVYGGSYGGYLTLCALSEAPDLWRAGVDLFGDSEIAESYRHGDRLGRIDLHRMMGDPDEPENAARYRRGSPAYRAERIEAPLLLLHGRRDKRVVPLMTERMNEALEIEDKYHEVHWYDDEAHGWKRRDNRRDAYRRILDFLRRHLLEVEPEPSGSSR